MVSDLVPWARSVAERFMPALGRRWDHVRAVAARAADLPFEAVDREVLVAAAYVHDIGYASALAVTGFHPLDGARFLRAEGRDELAVLVAHHSNARGEAALRGMNEYEDEFPYGATLLDDALTICDMTTSPDGHPISLDERIVEIVDRYGADHVTARAIVTGAKDFERAGAVVDRLCDEAGVGR
ncbi:MAG: HD domain-containing protein [Angustibacter sp.]